MPSEEKEKIVNDVISELGLESTRDTYIGTVRGFDWGQAENGELDDWGSARCLVHTHAQGSGS